MHAWPVAGRSASPLRTGYVIGRTCAGRARTGAFRRPASSRAFCYTSKARLVLQPKIGLTQQQGSSPAPSLRTEFPIASRSSSPGSANIRCSPPPPVAELRVSGSDSWTPRWRVVIHAHRRRRCRGDEARRTTCTRRRRACAGHYAARPASSTWKCAAICSALAGCGTASRCGRITVESAMGKGARRWWSRWPPGDEDRGSARKDLIEVVDDPDVRLGPVDAGDLMGGRTHVALALALADR